MKRVLRALVLTAIALMVIPAAVALADSGIKGFTSGFSVAQTSAGSIGSVPGGISLTGETFKGTIQGCTGQNCKLLEGASLSVNQNATLYITGFNPLNGAFSFMGPVNGTFTISKKIGKSVQSISGAYSGLVSGDLVPSPYLPPGAFVIQGANTSAWAVDATTATGAFESLKKASGAITSQIGGFFPGYEVINGTISGTTKDKDKDSD